MPKLLLLFSYINYLVIPIPRKRNTKSAIFFCSFIFLTSILQSYTMYTLVGSGNPGFSMYPDSAGSTINVIHGVAEDNTGNLYFTQGPKIIRRNFSPLGFVDFAGTTFNGYNGDGIPAVGAALNNPTCLSSYMSTLFVTDYGNNALRKIAGGIISNVTYGVSGNIGSQALDYTGGKLYFVDGNTIRLYDLNLLTNSLIAGNGSSIYNGDGIQASTAALSNVGGLAWDFGRGLIYLASTDQGRVRSVNVSTGIIQTIAGSGSLTNTASPALSAMLLSPTALTFDDFSDVLYIATERGFRSLSLSTSTIYNAQNQRLAKFEAPLVDTNFTQRMFGFSPDNYGPKQGLYGAIETSHSYMYLAPRSGILERYNFSTGLLSALTAFGSGGYSGEGVGTSTKIGGASGLAYVSSTSELLIADLGNSRIRKYSFSTGLTATIVGSGIGGISGDGGSALSARVNPGQIRHNPYTNELFFIDELNDVVRKVNLTTSIVSFVAGAGATSPCINGTPGNQAYFTQLDSMALDYIGNKLYVNDIGCGGNVIRAIDLAAGTVSGYAGGGADPSDTVFRSNAFIGTVFGMDMDVPGRKLYFSSIGEGRVRCIDLNTGMITTVANLPVLQFPSKIAYCPFDNNIYFTAYYTPQIYKLSLSTGLASLYAGNGGIGFSGDLGDPLFATMQRFNDLQGLMAFDSSGNLYFSDSTNNRVRAIANQTPTVSPTFSLSPTNTPTPSISPTFSPSFTPSISRTYSSTPTQSMTFSPVPTPTITTTYEPNCPTCLGAPFCDTFENVSNSFSTGQWNRRTGDFSVVQVVTDAGSQVLSIAASGGQWHWLMHGGFYSQADQVIEARIRKGGRASILARASFTDQTAGNPSDAYIFEVNNTFNPAHLLIYKLVNGIWNASYNLVTASVTVANPFDYVASFSVKGNLLSGSINGAVALSVSDSSLSTGSFGFMTFSNTIEVDDIFLNKGSVCPSATPTKTISSTHTFSPTDSPTFSHSPTFTSTPTASPSGTPSSSPSATESHSPTASPSASPTPTPTDTPSATQSASGTSTPSATQSATATSSPSATSSATLSASPTNSATKTLTPSSTITPSVTMTRTGSFTSTFSPTATPTATQSATWTASPTATGSNTPTFSPTITATLTGSPTWTATPSGTVTPTNSETASCSPTWTNTATPSASPTQSPSFSPSPTFSFSPTRSPTYTISPTPAQTATPAPPAAKQGLVFSYPNPAAPGQAVHFVFSPSTRASLKIFDWSGRKILDLPEARVNAGLGTAVWDGRDESGRDLASGAYFVVLKSDTGSIVGKLTVLRP